MIGQLGPAGSANEGGGSLGERLRLAKNEPAVEENVYQRGEDSRRWKVSVIPRSTTAARGSRTHRKIRLRLCRVAMFLHI